MSQEIGISGLEDLVHDAHITVVNALRKLPGDARQRVLRSVIELLDIGGVGGASSSPMVDTQDNRIEPSLGDFTKNRELGPKEFMLEKRPISDVEKVACLAYYLTHYRDTPEFKALDLSHLNTEAAQQKLSNPSYAVGNALKMGYLLSVAKGQKRLSAAGELYVQALPDRESAKAAMDHARPRKTTKRKLRAKSGG